MKTTILNGHKFEFHNDIGELTINQFHKYSKYLLVAGGVGDTIQDFDAHLTKVVEMIGIDNGKARQELLNMRQCYYMILNGEDVINKATMCLVKSVDGKEWADFSEDGIERLYCLAFNERTRKFVELRDALHKRIDEDLKSYFPDMFSSSDSKNQGSLEKKLAMLQLEAIIEDKDNTKDQEEVKRNLLRFYKPKSFEGDESAEVKFEKDFEEMCLAIAKEYGGRVKEYSVMEFYTAYTRMDRESKEMRKKLKK